jgi:hypothetical protein
VVVLILFLVVVVVPLVFYRFWVGIWAWQICSMMCFCILTSISISAYNGLVSHLLTLVLDMISIFIF